MSTDLLFAREALLAVALTIVPETIIVRLAGANVSGCEMGGELIT